MRMHICNAINKKHSPLTIKLTVMQVTTATKSTAFATRSLSRKLFTALALGVLFTACKKDDDNGNGGTTPPPAQDENYFASKVNMALTYQDMDDDGPTNHTLTVTGQRDSVGGKVIQYKSVYNGGETVHPFVYSKGNTFTLVSTPPSELNEMIEEMKNTPGVSDFEISGIPLLQHFPAAPQINQAITFSDPMHMGFNITEDGETYRMDMHFGFSEGKVVGFEDVTTQAGTFKNCVKVQYKATMKLETPAGENKNESVVTQWYAKGIGMVKSEDKDGTDVSTTTLTGITGK